VPTTLPGADLVEQGLEDLEARRETVEALLVSIAPTRLAAVGHTLPETVPGPEHRLYALLAKDDANAAHGRYNALLRQLTSYLQAAECVAP
jgi:hypothetical protein